MLALGPAVSANPEHFEVVASDSSTVNFTVRNAGSSVAGRFRKFTAQIDFDRLNFKRSWVKFQLEAASVATGNDQLDGRLNGATLLSSQRFPNIDFHSTKVVWCGLNRIDVWGDLTIRGNTRSVKVKVTDLGSTPGVKADVETFRAELSLRPAEFGGQGVEEVPVSVVLAAEARPADEPTKRGSPRP